MGPEEEACLEPFHLDLQRLLNISDGIRLKCLFVIDTKRLGSNDQIVVKDTSCDESANSRSLREPCLTGVAAFRGRYGNPFTWMLSLDVVLLKIIFTWRFC